MNESVTPGLATSTKYDKVHRIITDILTDIK